MLLFELLASPTIGLAGISDIPAKISVLIAGNAVKKGEQHTTEFVKANYHKVSDEYSDTLNVDGIMQFFPVKYSYWY